jgi:hypothetical protein
MDSIAFTIMAFGELAEDTVLAVAGAVGAAAAVSIVKARPAFPLVMTVGAGAPSCAEAEASSETVAASESHKPVARVRRIISSVTEESWRGLRG